MDLYRDTLHQQVESHNNAGAVPCTQKYPLHPRQSSRSDSNSLTFRKEPVRFCTTHGETETKSFDLSFRKWSWLPGRSGDKIQDSRYPENWRTGDWINTDEEVTGKQRKIYLDL